MTDRQHAADPSHRVIAGRYRLETRIGRGAMGTVWSSTDELLHRSVAVKELKLSPDLPEEDAAELRERALREARAMAVLAHPNVVMLHDVAWENNSPFVVMELVAAQSLAKILDVHGWLDQQQLASLANDVAAALQAAHRIGIVHRDVKPGNVLLSQDGLIKLSDFGIARNGADPTITKTGYLMGSPAFIAPELAVGDTVATSADLWSLGTMLFRAAEGHLPYDSNTDPLITVSSIINGKVPRHHQTGPIGEVISGLMVKDPTRRMPLEQVRRLVQHLLPEAGTNPFIHLLDHNAPALRGGANSPNPPAAPDRPGGGAPLPPSYGQQAAATRRAPGSSVPDGPAPHRKAWVPPVLASLGAAILLLLGTVGFLINDRNQADHARLSEDSSTLSKPRPSTPSKTRTPGAWRPAADARNAYNHIEAESYEGSRPAKHYTHGQRDHTDFIGLSTSDDDMVYRNVEFGAEPAQEVSAWLAPGTRGPVNGVLEIRLDDPNSTPIGQLAITLEGGRNNWKRVPIEILAVRGTHDVYLDVTADTAGDPPVVYLDSFRFHRGS